MQIQPFQSLPLKGRHRHFKQSRSYLWRFRECDLQALRWKCQGLVSSSSGANGFHCCSAWTTWNKIRKQESGRPTIKPAKPHSPSLPLCYLHTRRCENTVSGQCEVQIVKELWWVVPNALHFFDTETVLRDSTQDKKKKMLGERKRGHKRTAQENGERKSTNMLLCPSSRGVQHLMTFPKVHSRE